MNSAAADTSDRFIVVHITTPGTYYDRIGRYGILDTANPHMGTFISGIGTAATAAKIAREHNAR